MINHAVQVDALWFITSADSELAKYAIGQTVAYEVDAIDDFLEAGWSVLATGVLERYDGSATPLSFGPVPDPWPERSDEILLRLSWTDLTGRRLIPDKQERHHARFLVAYATRMDSPARSPSRSRTSFDG